MQKVINIPRHIPLDLRAIGPALALQRRQNAFPVKIVTDQHGNTVAYVAARVAGEVRS